MILVEDSLPVATAEASLVLQLEKAHALLTAARSLDDARQVEGFLRATLEWARRQEQISLALWNEAALHWLEARARQGEMLGQIDRQTVGRPSNRSSNNPFSTERPTLRELGYRKSEARQLLEIASVPRQERERLTVLATEHGQRMTQKALLDVAERARRASENGPVSGELPPRDWAQTAAPVPAGLLNVVSIGDARELSASLPDASVDLCLCDPVYDRVSDYEWLARQCERVLAPGGSVIAQCGNHRRFDCETAMRKSGLEFVDLLAEVYPYAIGRLFKPKVFVGWKPYLWFSRGPRRSGWVMNRLSVGGKAMADRSKEIHPWGDSEEFAAGVIAKLASAGGLIWDPFTGSGTVPAVARRLGFAFVAFEIDAQMAATAERRIWGTAVTTDPQVQMEFEGSSSLFDGETDP